jgi:hypothetical protein
MRSRAASVMRSYAVHSYTLVFVDCIIVLSISVHKDIS